MQHLTAKWAGLSSTAALPRTWYHACSQDRYDRVMAAGHFPADYSPRKAFWGKGVYLSDDKAEVVRFGEAVLTCTVAGRLYDATDQMGPLSVADDFPAPWADTYYSIYKAPYGPGHEAGDAMREVITRMGYDGISWAGDSDNPWAVVYEPTLVRVKR